MTGYVVYDVFTDRPFGGNPLAVIPDAAGLPDDRLQAIAREFNFSETTFVYPPRAPDHDARVRIFTPAQEIPFAGHPVIGTAVALAARRGDGAMTFELGVGPVPVEVSDGAAAFTITRAPEVLHRPDRDFVAASLSLTPPTWAARRRWCRWGCPSCWPSSRTAPRSPAPAR